MRLSRVVGAILILVLIAGCVRNSEDSKKTQDSIQATSTAQAEEADIRNDYLDEAQKELEYLDDLYGP